jgi:molybdopterin-guanine dinucleotide biosynthesis protein A
LKYKFTGINENFGTFTNQITFREGMKQVIGIILAGGKSRRMGQDKSAMLFNGLSLLQNMIAILSQTQISKVVINRNFTVAEQHDLERQKQHYIHDIIPNKGPLSGIHSALLNFPDANLLVVPVDIPLITSYSLNTLISAAHTHAVNCRFVPVAANDKVTESKPSTLPLFIHNNSETQQALEQTLTQSHKYSVFRFCEQFPMFEVALENDAELTNLNYPWQLNK